MVVDYPYTDLSGEKRRPALVVSNDRYNRGLDIFAVPITSTPYHTAVEVIFQGKSSFIRTDTIQTIEQSRVQRIGDISEDLFAEVKLRLLRNL